MSDNRYRREMDERKEDIDESFSNHELEEQYDLFFGCVYLIVFGLIFSYLLSKSDIIHAYLDKLFGL